MQLLYCRVDANRPSLQRGQVGRLTDEASCCRNRARRVCRRAGGLHEADMHHARLPSCRGLSMGSSIFLALVPVSLSFFMADGATTVPLLSQFVGWVERQRNQ